MGTDIHGVVEERIAPNTWVTVNVLGNFLDEHGHSHWCAARARNYERFAALAGVRGDGPAPRGLPIDASETARYLFQKIGDHTPSWLPLDEASVIFARTDPFISESDLQKINRRELDSSFNAYYFSEMGEGDEFRFVFWFDN